MEKIGIDDMRLFPPGPGKCPVCAATHPPEVPHNRDSLYYQIKFRQEHGRFPTWQDAAAHCTPEIRAWFAAEYAKHGIEIDVGLRDGS